MSGCNKFHDEFKEEENHHIQAFSYDTQADRLAATGYPPCPGDADKPFDADDVGKIAKQQNINPSDGEVTFWVLCNHSPVTWDEITNKSVAPNLDVKVSVSANDTTAGYLTDKLTESIGTNTNSRPLQYREINDGSDEDLDLRFDASKIDHDDLINSGGAEHIDWTSPGAGTIDPSNYLSGAGVYGTEFQQASSDSTSSTTSSIFQQKLRLTTSSLPSGSYRIGFYCETWQSNASDAVEFQVELNDSDVLNTGIREPDDGTDRFTDGGFAYRSLSGINNIDIDYREQRGSTAFIRRARLEIWRVS